MNDDFSTPKTPLSPEQIADRLKVYGMSEIRKLVSAGRINQESLAKAISLIPKTDILERDAMRRMIQQMEKKTGKESGK